MSPPKFVLYTDGSCSPNPGPAASAYVIYTTAGNVVAEVGKYIGEATNNIAEMKAVLFGLQDILDSFGACEVVVVSDSKYVVDGFRNRWLENWKRNGWRTASKKPVQNKEQWQDLDNIRTKHALVEFFHVAAHAGNRRNNYVDALANSTRTLRKDITIGSEESTALDHQI